jgi:hypothetical protein
MLVFNSLRKRTRMDRMSTSTSAMSKQPTRRLSRWEPSPFRNPSRKMTKTNEEVSRTTVEPLGGLQHEWAKLC